MAKLLIVDDLALFHEPISAVMRQEGFEVQAATNGLQALRAIREWRPDVVLLDIMMSELDGLSCLERIRNDPEIRDTAVIMFTARAERAFIKRAGQLRADAYVLKPHFTVKGVTGRIRQILEARELAALKAKQAAEKAAARAIEPLSGAPPAMVATDTPSFCDTAAIEVVEESSPRTALNADSVLAAIRKEIELKAVPSVLQQVIGLTNSRESTMQDVAEAIRLDHALALKVLHIANSSVVGANRRAKTVMEAAQRIGLAGVRNIAAAVVTIENFGTATLGGFHMRPFWKHSLLTAKLSELIGHTLNLAHKEELYLAGLMHDLGRVVLASTFPKEYEAVLREAAAGESPLDLIERRVFGLTHADVSRAILQEWKCSERLAEAALLHDAGERRITTQAREPRFTLAVALANAMAHAGQWGDSGNSTLLPIGPLVTALALPVAEVQILMDTAASKSEEAELILASHGNPGMELSVLRNSASDAMRQVRVAVFHPQAPNDELTAFADQNGMLEPENARVALIRSTSLADGRRQLKALITLEGTLGRQLPIVLLLDRADPPDSAAPFADRSPRRVEAPFLYSKIQSQIADAIPVEASSIA